MKIGVMLRNLGEPGGIGVYTNNIVNNLLQIDRKNRYVIMYALPECLGHFSSFPNVTELVVSAPNKFWWDQVSVPRLARKENLDLIYNPKLSIPIFTKCKTVLVMHGGEAGVIPGAYKLSNRIYFTIANPLYLRRANAVITMTRQGAKDIVEYMGGNPNKINVIYESYNELCRVLEPEYTLAVKEKYSLPKSFILFVGGLSPRKNYGNLLRAYAKLRHFLPHKLVFVGFKRQKYAKDLNDLQLIDQLGLSEQVIFTGFVPDEDIPAIYNLADLFVLPSLYEGFGIPVLEAMACGCPVITTKNGCTPEVAGDAGILIDPYNVDELAEAIQKVIRTESLRKELIVKGINRVKQFSWKKCAEETLALFESL